MGLFDTFKKNEPVQPQRKQQPLVAPVEIHHQYKKDDVIGGVYKVFDVLGKGGCGIVYRVYSKEVHSRETGNVCALKTFLDKYMADLPTRERFKKEAAVWVSLDKHPYIVTAYFVAEISGRPFIGMEYIEPPDGGWNTLDDYLKYQQIDFIQGLRWAIQFCYGMEHAYGKGIKAHRDIKPANIMISSDKSVKITDLGLAGFIDARKDINKAEQGNVGTVNRYQTIMNVGMGTPTHMPPEQFLSAAGCNERSDIYSFGVVLYQIASGGKLPFNTDNYAQFWQIMQHMHTEKDVPRINSKFDSVIQRCMAKKPSDRFQSFVEIRRKLDALLKEETGEVVKVPEISEITVRELTNKGLSLNNIGMFVEAIECLDKAIFISPNFWRAWCNKGLALANLGRYDEAIKVLLHAINIEPRDSAAWLNLGMCYDYLNNIEESYKCFIIAAELDPSSYLVYYNVGNTLYKTKKFDEALINYNKALKIYPHFASALSNKGLTLMEIGNYQEALLLIDESLKINPLNCNALRNKAKCHKEQKEYNEAIKAYKKSISINAKSTVSLNELGLCYSELKEYEKAMECFQRTLEIDSGNLDALRTKILCFWSMGQPGDAHMFSRMALMIIPNDPFILFLKASIEDNLGKVPEAIESYTRFVKNASSEMGDQVNIAKGRIATLSKR